MSTSNLHCLRDCETRVGTWLSIGSPVIAELAAAAGFDWLLFDLEHGCATESNLLSNLQSICATQTDAIVRVGAPYPDLILRILDWGAHGIMVPKVESATKAGECIKAIHYPPRGQRGFSRSARANGFGLDGVGFEKSLPDPVLIVQIETIAGVRNVRDIAAIPGVDMLFVGPSDLAFDLSARGVSDADAKFEECLQRVVGAAREFEKSTGIVVRSVDEIERLKEIGFNHFLAYSDIGILRGCYEAVISHTKTSEKSLK